jgi:exopolysaccharide biosynthesis polyprenyl glycosylphosphotransferase
LLKEHPECGLQPVGFIDASNRQLDESAQPLPVVGQAQHLAEVITREDIKHVILGFPSGRAADLIGAIRTCDRLACEIWALPRMLELSQAKSSDVDTLWGIPLMRLRRAASRSSAWRLKRLMDVIVAATSLVLLSPLLGVIALAVRVALGAPILFRQQRLGVDGRQFTLLKFRSLPSRSSEETAVTWTAGDVPVSRVGRMLRRTSLDELPQLWNIVRGDMSLVGPRPERPYFAEQFSERYPDYVARHRVPSGLTGWAQIHGLRGDTSIEDRARFDNYYIDNWSLSLDLRILLRTVFAALHRESG